MFFLIHVYFLATSFYFRLNDTKRIGIALLLVILLQYQALGSSLFFHIQKFFEAIALVPLILLNSRCQIDLLRRFQFLILSILTISLFFWFGHLLGIDLPSTDVTFGVVERNGIDQDQYHFSNHFLYLVNQSWFFSSSSVAPNHLRFSSVFLEPGYLSILMVFFLFINNFDFRKKRNFVYLLTIIASISLAGFLMGVFAFIAYRLQNLKYGLVSIVLFFFLIWIGGYFFEQYNGGNNIINKNITQRLEVEQNSGTIAGYNRTSERFDNAYTKFLSSGGILYGIRRDGMDKMFGDASNVGYKVYIMTYGLLGLLLFIIYLFSLSRLYGNYKSYILFFLYVIMFMRGHHTMYSYAFMLVFICGITEIHYQNIK